MKILGQVNVFRIAGFFVPILGAIVSKLSLVLNGRNGNGETGNTLRGEVHNTVLNSLGSEYFAGLDGVPVDNGMPVWKRALDISGTLLVLFLIAPVLLLISIYIQIVSPGSILFTQERVGFNGRIFKCRKFRTMHEGAETTVHKKYFCDLMKQETEMKKLDEEDPRIIPYGHLLRKTGLDELPQLINVIAGEMSLVGPRPCIPYEARHYEVWQRRRFFAVPGLTGLWQVNGKNKTTFNEMMRYDISYAEQRSFWLDIRILIKTVPAIINQVIDK
jgi:exopolysaccharide production protein ExoY